MVNFGKHMSGVTKAWFQDGKFSEEPLKNEESVPVILASTSPFRLIKRDRTDNWKPTWDELNKRNYDYVKLSRLSTFIDVGLPNPFSMGVGFDGTLVLPALSQFADRDVVLSVFND